MEIISVKNLKKSFGNLKVLDRLEFNVQKGEFFSILGPSGCGKTTLLNTIVGILKPDSGKIILKGEDITGRIVGKFGYMLQKDLLLPWRTVFGNLKLVTEVSENTDDVDSLVREYLKKVNLNGFENFYPYQLSGGMAKRVSLARTLMYCKIQNSDLILMDEPFSNLDAITKRGFELDLKRILKEEKKTIIFVTHDVDEALLLSDRIAILTKRPAKIKNIYVVNGVRKEKLRDKIIANLQSEAEEDVVAK